LVARGQEGWLKLGEMPLAWPPGTRLKGLDINKKSEGSRREFVKREVGRQMLGEGSGRKMDKAICGRKRCGILGKSVPGGAT
jgi:hypothetical protein